MIKLLNSKNHSTYTSKELIGKYIYVCKSNTDNKLLYICKINNIEYDGNITDIKYICDKVYVFMIPNDTNRKAFLYDNYTCVSIDGFNDELYELTFSEFVNTFREFITNDGKLVSELPDKIIQDN